MENNESEADWPPLRERRRERIEETAKTLMGAMMPKTHKSVRLFSYILQNQKDDVRELLDLSFETAERFVDAFDEWIANKEPPTPPADEED